MSHSHSPVRPLLAALATAVVAFPVAWLPSGSAAMAFGASIAIILAFAAQLLISKVMGWSPLLETASEVPKCGEWKFPPSKRGDRNEAYDDWY